MKRESFQYILFYKPYLVLSQFTKEDGKQSLADFHLPKNIYPVGRLDYDSEGLLLLTNDNAVKYKLTNPKFEHPKTYLVQIEKIPSEESLNTLRGGIVIEGKRTKRAEIRLLNEEPNLPPRSIPIRFRKTVPAAWVEIILREGRNRQIRKMTAAIGHPTLRLIRSKIGKLEIETLQPGEWKKVKQEEIL